MSNSNKCADDVYTIRERVVKAATDFIKDNPRIPITQQQAEILITIGASIGTELATNLFVEATDNDELAELFGEPV